MAGFAVLCAVLGFLTKSFLGVSKQWTITGERLERLGKDLRDVITWKDREHARLDERLNRVDGRIERHETWHDDHPHA